MTQLTAKKDWKEIFIAKLRKSPNVSAAARAAGYSRQWAYQMRGNDPDFAAEWDDAIEESMDVAEGEIYRRAVRGVVRRVFYKGEEIDRVREYSDTLLIFLAKAYRPDKYKETVRNEMTGKNGEPIEHKSTVTHDIDSATSTTIFDILAAAGVFESVADGSKDDKVHST